MQIVEIDQFKKCLNCNYEFQFIHSNEKYCEENCRIEHKKSINALSQYKRRMKEYVSSGLLSDEKDNFEFVSFRVLYSRQYGFCAFCRKKFVDIADATFDHIIPIVKNGSHDYKNVELLHKECNSAKNDSSEEDFQKNIYYKLSLLHTRKELKEYSLLSETEKHEKMKDAMHSLYLIRNRVGGVK